MMSDNDYYGHYDDNGNDADADDNDDENIFGYNCMSMN